MNREQLISLALKHHLDPHTVTAANSYNIPYTEVTPAMRTNEKTANFIYLYSPRFISRVNKS